MQLTFLPHPEVRALLREPRRTTAVRANHRKAPIFDPHASGNSAQRPDPADQRVDDRARLVHRAQNAGVGPRNCVTHVGARVRRSAVGHTTVERAAIEIGEVERRRHRAEVRGLVVDDEGHLWVAVFGGSAVLRFAPDGRLVARVAVGASQVSSCCLAGGRLVMTTTTEGQDDPEPDAGRLFSVEVGVSAAAVRPFLGRLPG